MKKEVKQKKGVQKIQCKYCGFKHERNKRKCPALGKKCASCQKLIYFASQCQTKKSINAVESEGWDNFDEIRVVNTIQVARPSESSQFPSKIYSTINVGKNPVKFQLDSGGRVM